MTTIRRLVGVMGGLLLAGALISTALAAEPRATGTLVNGTGATVGRVELEQTAAGVVLTVEARGLTPGQHGIHLHAVGRCEGPAFASAGGHFNPGGKKHGLKSPDGAHAGDLPNLTVDATGQTRATLTAAGVTLMAGPTSLLDADGAAVVIHAGPDDDLTDPAGNSGDRIACAQLALAPALPRTGLGGPEADATAALLGGGGLLLGLAWLLGRRSQRAS